MVVVMATEALIILDHTMVTATQDQEFIMLLQDIILIMIIIVEAVEITVVIIVVIVGEVVVGAVADKTKKGFSVKTERPF
jgi:hypothetical protein